MQGGPRPAGGPSSCDLGRCRPRPKQDERSSAASRDRELALRAHRSRSLPYPLPTERAADARQDRPPYRPSADCLSVERPAERSPRLSDSTCSSSLARRAALTSLTSGKEHPNCRALFCTATWRRFRTTEARAGETPFWTRAKRSSMCSGVQLRRDTRTMLDYSCWLSFRAARSDRFAQSIPTRFCRSVRRRTETLRPPPPLRRPE